MNQRLLKTLNFVKLLDETGSLSLSNVAMMVVLIKLALAPEMSLAEAAILLPVIGNYAFKGYHLRHARATNLKVTESAAEALMVLASDVEKLKLASGLRSR